MKFVAIAVPAVVSLVVGVAMGVELERRSVHTWQSASGTVKLEGRQLRITSDNGHWMEVTLDDRMYADLRREVEAVTKTEAVVQARCERESGHNWGSDHPPADAFQRYWRCMNDAGVYP